MITLDIPTLAITASGLQLLVAGIMLGAHSPFDARVGASIRIWAMALLFLALSTILYSAASPATLATILIGNTSLFAGFTGFAIAVRAFLDRPLPAFAYWLPILLVAIGTLYFATLVPSYPARVVLVVGFQLALLATVIRPLLGTLPVTGQVGHKVVVLCFLASIAVLILRLFHEYGAAPASIGPPPFSLDLVGLHLLVIWLSPVVASIGFLVMCNQRLTDNALMLARTDALTGLLGRRALIESGEAKLADATRNARALAMLMIDADHFKRVNDEHGHEVGDAALVRVAQRVRAALRDSDLLGRIGGEEFLAILPDTDQAQAVAIAERILVQVRAFPLRHGDKELGLSVSVGVASADATSDFDALLRRADSALYAAKRQGRNRVVCAGTQAADPT